MTEELNDMFLDTLSRNILDTSFVVGIKTAGSSPPVFSMFFSRCLAIVSTWSWRLRQNTLRMDRLDADVFLERTIDEQAYILQCFRVAK